MKKTWEALNNLLNRKTKESRQVNAIKDFNRNHKELLIAEPPRAQRRERGAPYLRENGKLSVQENLVMKSPYVLPY